MSRHKSRVTRRGRRKSRAGTRKQSGGFLGWLFGYKKTDPAAADNTNPNSAAGTPPAADAKAVADAKAAADTNAPADANATADANAATVNNPQKSFLDKLKFWKGGSRKKSRKTQHRRRHHRHRK